MKKARAASIYFTMKRSKLIPSLVVFDAPDGTVGVGDRSSTTVAPQSLHLMNNPHVRAAAYGLAKRTRRRQDLRRRRSDTGVPDRVVPCTDKGRTEGCNCLLEGASADARETAMADLCQVLFCLNEFLYVE